MNGLYSPMINCNNSLLHQLPNHMAMKCSELKQRKLYHTILLLINPDLKNSCCPTCIADSKILCSFLTSESMQYAHFNGNQLRTKNA